MGSGGAKGAAGQGGGAGCGGNAGQSFTTQGEQSARGQSGSSGRRGFPGRSGQTGRNGKDGLDGKDGSITYVLFDSQTGSILQRSSSIYHPIIEQFQVHPEVDDGVIEPSERISVSGVRIRNAGGIVLPPGVCLRLQCENNFQLLEGESSFVIPHSIERDQTVTLPITLVGAVGSLLTDSSFCIQLSLLERTFSSVQRYTLGRVEYPVFVRLLRQVTGTVGSLELILEIENRSQLPYGLAAESGSVEIALEPEQGVRIVNHEIQVPQIPPHGVVQVRSIVEILPEVAFYSMVPYRIIMSLRGREVQSGASVIRCVPTFDFTNPQSDLLLLVTSSLHQGFFCSLERVTAMLQLKYQIWDAQLYGSLCTYGPDQQPAPWIDQYEGQLIVLVANSSDELAALPPSIIYRHFYTSGPVNPCRTQSSLLILQEGNVTARHFTEHLFRDPALYTASNLKPEVFADWFSMSRVSQLHMNNKCNEIEKNYYQEHPHNICQVHLDQFLPSCIRRGRSLIWSLWSYGSAHLRVSSFDRSCNIQIASVKEAEIPNQLLCALVESLPYEYQIPLFHPSMYESLRPLVSQPLEWIRTMMHSRLKRLVLHKPLVEVERELQHVENLLRASMTSQQDTECSSSAPQEGVDITLLVEFLVVLYRLHSDLNPTWLSTHKKKKRKRLLPLQNLINQLERLLPRLNADLLHQKAAEPLMICHPVSQNLWRTGTK